MTVLDPSGAAIPAVPVGLIDATGAVRSLATNNRGEVVFENLPPGPYSLHIERPGFQSVHTTVSIKAGSNRKEVRLALAAYAEELTVRQSDTDRTFADSFTSTLTPEQIAQLPDDPDEMEQMLLEMAGPGAVMHINGFRGGRLPPKSQIREIRFRLDPYAAENHEPGFTRIDVRTKPGAETWHGGASFAFRDETLNARNALAPAKAAEQTRRYGWSMDGPVVRNRTSFSLSVDGTSAYEAKTIRAADPAGLFTGLFRHPTDRLNITAQVEQTLGKSHTVRAEFQRNNRDQNNLGVGDFDLLERAYSRDQRDTIVRFSDVGAIGRRASNEFRAQFRLQDTALSSLSDETTIQVLNAFSSGGAQLEGGRRAREMEVADNLDFSVGRHAFRAGMLLETGWYHADEQRNANGTFVFSSLEAYALARPLTYTQRLGNPTVDYSQYQFAWFVQNDLRLRKNLLLSAGLRHEMQTHLGDWLNLAPRVGLSWSPFKKNTTTIRAGAGLFYDWYESQTYEQTLRVNGERQRDLVIRNPGFPDPSSGGREVTLPPSRIQASTDLVMPLIQRASLGVEQQIGWARIRGNLFIQHSANELRSRNINAPIDGVRPDPAVGNISQIESTGRASSQGFDLGLNAGNPTRGLFLAANYLFSVRRNDTDDPLSLPADSLNPGADWGFVREDVRHRLFSMINTRLPGGFRLATMFRAQSGTPYNITTGFDDNGDTVINDRPAGVARNSARGSAQFDLDARLSWSKGFGQRVDTSPMGGGPMIVRIGGDRDEGPGGISGGPGPGGFGRAGDSRWRVELYAQAFNLLNQTNLMNYSGVLTSPFFGQALAAQPPRRIEAGLRVTF